MKADLMYLVWVTALTAVLWLPYVLDRILTGGLMDAVGYPKAPKPQSEWAKRMKAAHANTIENLVIFAALVLAAHAAGISNETTAMAGALFFWSRLVYVVVYTFGIPWARTLAFAAGFVAQVIMVLQLLGK